MVFFWAICPFPIIKYIHTYFEKEVAKILGILQKDYQGKSLKDDNDPSPFPNVDSLLIVNCLRLFENVVKATFGHVLSSNYEEVISRFGISFTTNMSTFHISMTPEVHILLHHIPQFIRITQMSLGLFSVEIVEGQHKRFF